MKSGSTSAALLLKLKLCDRLRSLGYRAGDGVSLAGIDLMTRAAKRAGVPDWPYAKTPIDFVRLTRAVGRELELEGKV